MVGCAHDPGLALLLSEGAPHAPPRPFWLALALGAASLMTLG